MITLTSGNKDDLKIVHNFHCRCICEVKKPRTLPKCTLKYMLKSDYNVSNTGSYSGSLVFLYCLPSVDNIKIDFSAKQGLFLLLLFFNISVVCKAENVCQNYNDLHLTVFTTGTCFIQKIYAPPPLPYFKVNICLFPLPHFASIFFAYL